MASQVPSFYRIWFTIVDPILSLIGVASNIFAPTSILNSYSPSFANPPTAETVVLLDSVSGFLTALTFLQLVLLRARPNDLAVWRSLQAAVLLVDFFMLVGFARALGMQERTSWTVWRTEEWTNLGVTGAVAVIRTSFLMGLGMGGHGKSRMA
jgi:hypothetical protein